MFETAWRFVTENVNWIGAVCAVLASANYSRSKHRSRIQVGIIWSLIVVGMSFFVTGIFLPELKFTFRQVIGTLVIYGAALYAGLCDILRFGLAAYLTRMRGEKWVKELDYVYLTLGALGVLGSVNKLELAGGHYSQFDLLGPFVVASAIVVRLIKTRAEIDGWNKAPRLL